MKFLNGENKFVGFGAISKRTPNSEIYYPIIPRIAILVTNVQTQNDCNVAKLGENEVSFYNNLMCSTASRYVFADSSAHIENIRITYSQ